MTRKTLLPLAALFLLCTAPLCFGSATNVYVTPAGSATGSCPAGTGSAPNLVAGSSAAGGVNAAAAWGSGTGQIGPGTTLLVCGTYTNATPGGQAIIVQNSGTSGAPIVILFDSAGAQFNSTGWWGSTTNTGAITINAKSYITINGQGTGIIQNMLAGTSGNTCVGGTCTQVPGGSGTTGIAVVNAANILIENLTIQNMYANAGSSSSATDTGGQFSTNISIYASSPITVANNKLNNASIGIATSQQGQSGETGGTTSCPTVLPITSPGSGVCFGFNTLTDHHWQLSNGANGGVGTFNVYNNNISGFTNWQFPTSAYHTDGIITYGGANTIATNNIWNNTFTGDLGNGSATAFIYCTSDGGNDGSGSNCNVYNNLFIGDSNLNTFMGVGTSSGDATGQTDAIYNNTFEQGGFDLYVYVNSGGPNHTITMKNNIMVGGTGTYFYVLNGNPLASSNNTFYSGRSDAWNGSTSLAAWQTACSCDASSQVANPNLGAGYVPNAGSPVILAAANLTSSATGGLAELTADQAGNPRPGLPTAWDTGAYQYSSGPPTPNPPHISILVLNP